MNGKIIFKTVLLHLMTHLDAAINFYDNPQKLNILRLIRTIKRRTKLLLTDDEACQLYLAVKKTAKILGDIAEVGVFKGGSAKLICQAKGGKTLHLFDTFTGLPAISPTDDPKQFYPGQFSAALPAVKKYLNKYSNVHFYKGIFPDTAKPIENKRFSLVHLDLDIYKSTSEAIKFFYPKMNRGGVIISHDYANAPGVSKAFDEYFKDKPEPVIELSGSQCLVIKL